MSVERCPRKNGPDVWRVRWRDPNGENRAHVVGSKADAVAYDAEIKRRKRLGDLASLDAGKQTLADFAGEWWELYAKTHLARSTQELYASLLDGHIMPMLGPMPLREITPEAIERWKQQRLRDGAGPAVLAKAFTLLGSILARAAEWGRIPSNPARVVRKPPGQPSKTVRPLAPATVERIRDALSIRDATLVSVLAYAGLRPQEALALTWGDIRERTLLIDKAAAHGQVKATKTGHTRTVRLLAPLASDLAAWRLASGRPEDASLVFPSGSGGVSTKSDYQNWRRRKFVPASRAAGQASCPYDLRHSFCSLLAHEGMTVVEIARQMGHKPSVCWNTYMHVFEELEGAERRPAEDEIRAARGRRVPDLYPRTQEAEGTG